MPDLFDTESIILATEFDSNTENAAVYRILKPESFCHGDTSKYLMC